MFVLEIQKLVLPLLLVKGAPLEKGQNLHRAFFLSGRVLYFFEGCVLPDVMVLRLIQWTLVTLSIPLPNMVKFSTRLSFDVKLESSRVRETARIISKVLRVSKETIRTRLRKLT